MLEEIQLEEDSEVTTPDKIKKKWRAKVENKTLDPNDLINYFQLSASYFLTVTRKDNGSDIGELRLRLFYSHCSPTMSCNFISIQNQSQTKRKFGSSLSSFAPSLSLSISFSFLGLMMHSMCLLILIKS